MDGWGLDWAAWQRITPEVLGERLAAGANPDAGLPALGNTPLFEVLNRPAAREMIELLVAYGAKVDAVNLLGQTPLWEAVRIGRRDAVTALLRAGADPWRRLFGQWSPGLLGLCGPFADLFEDLPGGLRLGPNMRELQDYADVLIDSYGTWKFEGNPAFGFISGVREEEVVRRLGADPDACPPIPQGGHPSGCRSGGAGHETIHLATSPWGGVVLHQYDGVALVVERICRALTTPYGLMASVLDDPGGRAYVHVWQDGRRVRQIEPGQEPGAEGRIEEWLCRFGDLSGVYGRMERALACMSMITGVAAEEQWTHEAPHRRIKVSR
ncbi:hypothetical protein Misp01_60090 [Microtetraspora sp. NBRC 13810]|uniref:ankyrin repeat domain-containing protein n=1 Tax=Microtetraspora sp. NBRC 13810 TaxID=3030990 RepID=UPI0024A1CF0F|nr:ankyrin repeat domain-containing protein [Microtetraspora sp. NBRC 13810]GLW10881.1 hypothetical protein Misp01_60090 [Microtetraspora sp. NBRC 13810]